MKTILVKKYKTDFFNFIIKLFIINKENYTILKLI